MPVLNGGFVMNTHEAKVNTILFIITLIICGFMWLVLGTIGYNHLGWSGIGLAAIPPFMSAAFLFWFMRNLLRHP